LYLFRLSDFGFRVSSPGVAEIMRKARMWNLIVFVGLPLLLCPYPIRGDEPPPPAAAIRQWIKDLDDDRFAVREAASRHLAQAGHEAIDAVVQSATGNSLEVTVRAVRIVTTWSASQDTQTAGAAKAALVKLADSRHPAAASRAKEALLDLQLQVVRRLEQIGASVEIDSSGITSVNLDKVGALATALPLLRQLPDLEDLSLSNSRMNDDLMAELKDLPKLKHLNLYRSGVGDAGLKYLKNLPSLRSVPMGETKVTDAGLVHLKDLKQLEYVGLRADKITDAGLEHLQDLTNLTGLYLGETKVTDAGLVHLKRMTKMNYLLLDHTGVTDAGLEHLKGMTNLGSLDLSHTKVTEAGLNKLRKAVPGLRGHTEER
jgi:hypothetical protein